MTATSNPANQRTLVELLTGGSPEAPAFVVPEDDRTISRREFDDAVDTLAAGLNGLGLERGDRVALSLANGPEIVELIAAALRLGITASPLNPAYTASEFRFYLEDLQPKAIVLPDGDLPMAREAAGEILAIDLLTTNGRPPALAQDGRNIPLGSADTTAQPDDIALLLHTSGTTSRPKQVPLLHRNIASSVSSIKGHFKLSPDDLAYCAMPLFHVHGLIGCVFSSLAAGSPIIVPRRFSPGRFWAHEAEFEPTWISAVPTVYTSLLQRRQGEPPRPGSRMRFARSASSALAPALLESVEEHLGVPMLEAYGMTEGSHQITANPLPPGQRVPSSVGASAGSEVAVVDDAGNLLPEETSGEVAIRGPAVTPGYANNPEANAASFTNGWFRTGDRGSIKDGYVYLEGRIKELINRGGEKISPHEVEHVLLTHPAVSEAVVFGEPDDKYGERVAAAVLMGSGTTVDQLRDYCRDQLAPFKVPVTVHVVDAIPRTPTGKLQRSRMHDLLRG